MKLDFDVYVSDVVRSMPNESNLIVVSIDEISGTMHFLASAERRNDMVRIDLMFKYLNDIVIDFFRKDGDPKTLYVVIPHVPLRIYDH